MMKLLRKVQVPLTITSCSRTTRLMNCSIYRVRRVFCIGGWNWYVGLSFHMTSLASRRQMRLKRKTWGQLAFRSSRWSNLPPKKHASTCTAWSTTTAARVTKSSPSKRLWSSWRTYNHRLWSRCKMSPVNRNITWLGRETESTWYCTLITMRKLGNRWTKGLK